MESVNLHLNYLPDYFGPSKDHQIQSIILAMTKSLSLFLYLLHNIDILSRLYHPSPPLRPYRDHSDTYWSSITPWNFFWKYYADTGKPKKIQVGKLHGFLFKFIWHSLNFSLNSKWSSQHFGEAKQSQWVLQSLLSRPRVSQNSFPKLLFALMNMVPLLKSFFAQNRKFEKPKSVESIPIVLRYARKYGSATGAGVC